MGAYLRRLRSATGRICFLELRFERSAPTGRCGRQPRAQFVALLRAVPTPMDFHGVQTCTHDDAPSPRIYVIVTMISTFLRVVMHWRRRNKSLDLLTVETPSR
jgi:hypothetical protein